MEERMFDNVLCQPNSPLYIRRKYIIIYNYFYLKIPVEKKGEIEILFFLFFLTTEIYYSVGLENWDQSK